jgi:hypothetical protein
MLCEATAGIEELTFVVESPAMPHEKDSGRSALEYAARNVEDPLEAWYEEPPGDLPGDRFLTALSWCKELLEALAKSGWAFTRRLGDSYGQTLADADHVVAELQWLLHKSRMGELWQSALYLLWSYHAFDVEPDGSFRCASGEPTASDVSWWRNPYPDAIPDGERCDADLAHMELVTEWLSGTLGGVTSGKRSAVRLGTEVWPVLQEAREGPPTPAAPPTPTKPLVCPCGKGVWQYKLSQKELAAKLGLGSTARVRQVSEGIEKGGARKDGQYAECTACGVEFYRRQFGLGVRKAGKQG